MASASEDRLDAILADRPVLPSGGLPSSGPARVAHEAAHLAHRPARGSPWIPIVPAPRAPVEALARTTPPAASGGGDVGPLCRRGRVERLSSRDTATSPPGASGCRRLGRTGRRRLPPLFEEALFDSDSWIGGAVRAIARSAGSEPRVGGARRRRGFPQAEARPLPERDVNIPWDDRQHGACRNLVGALAGKASRGCGHRMATRPGHRCHRGPEPFHRRPLVLKRCSESSSVTAHEVACIASAPPCKTASWPRFCRRRGP
jgi:hypothetical protein